MTTFPWRPEAPRQRGPWRTAAFAATAAFGTAVATITHSAAAGDVAAVVKLNNDLKFAPAKVTIKVGGTVRWKNVSDLVHTVTDDPTLVAKEADQKLPEGAKAFNSGNLKPKATFTHTFAAPGTYRYFCIPHEGARMVAEVEVTK